MTYFYSHAREGRDIKNAQKRVISDDFYSHAREGRDCNTGFGISGTKFLLTRPRGA